MNQMTEAFKKALDNSSDTGSTKDQRAVRFVVAQSLYATGSQERVQAATRLIRAA